MKLTYYPGCSLTGTAREYDVSVRNLARLLDIELVELDDWNCCGASSAHMTNHELAIKLSARNLEIAQEAGHDLLVPCSACYQRLKAADFALRNDPHEWEYETYEPDFNIVHISSLLDQPEFRERLKNKARRGLSKMKIACYYGCLALRPPKITGEMHYEIPTRMEEILTILDADPLAWSHKTECCGGSLTMARPDISRQLVGDILEAAARAGAEALVTDCPMCHANLESRQLDLLEAGTIERTTPIFYLSELIEFALSERIDASAWKGHLVEAEGVFSRLIGSESGLEE